MKRTAIVGLGRMGVRHATVARQVGLDLVGFSDVIDGTLQAAGDQFDVPAEARFSDPAVMLAATRPEVLIISTTAPSHSELVQRATEFGIEAILCEKPVATSIAASDAMIAACRKSGTRLAINHQMRFMEQYTIPKALVDSESLGGLGSIMVSAGNFGMAMNGTHYFEMFRYLTGEAPASVSAWFAKDILPNPRGPQFSDAAGSVRIVTQSGKRFFMDCSPDQGHGMFVTYNCRNGRIDIDELTGHMTVTVRDEEHRSAPTTRYGMPYSVTSSDIAPADAVAPTRAVLEALLKGENFPTGEDGRLALVTLVAAHLSNERGGASVRIDDPSLPLERELPIA